MSPITTHVLDTARGVPAAGIPVKLQKTDTQKLTLVAHGVTDADGRIMQWDDESFAALFTPGMYQITFDTDAYHQGQGFFPQVSVTFRVTDVGQHYHVPLLLSPFSYSTYRGS